MKILQKILILISVSLFLSCGEDSTISGVEFGKITGKVVKASTFEPIENAKITLSPTNNTTFTDVNGEFLYEEAPINEYSVEASKDGFLASFEPVSLEEGATVNVVFEMQVETGLNSPPITPELLLPIDGAVDTENTVELVWSSSSVDDDELTYRLDIKNDFNNDVITVQSLSDTTYVVSNLKFGGKYFWQVAVTDNINSEVLSASNSFTVKENTENRYMYVKVEGGNNVIYSSSLNEDSDTFNTVQLTESNSNSWRPRKNNTVNLIAFLRMYNNKAHIFTMKPDGSDVKRVTSDTPVSTFDLNEVDFSWSTTGDKFIYPSFDKLYMINKDGSGLQLIYKTTNGHLITECDWSSDGTRIVLRTNNSDGYDGSIYTIDMSGTVINTVVSANIGALGGLNLSVDGNLLIYTKDVSDFQSSNYRRLDNKIFKYNLATMTETEILIAKPSGSNDLDPRLSPNEAEIIYVNTSNDGISDTKIFVSPIDGSNSRQEVFQSAIMPDWE
ncbi:carboxypeptidase regulatory-like domain-containing protein [Polaribacter sp. Q13]|uniref:carboxypeptidase regulatory-like domain-containing protein n=1 Tax=Polaribacter sp. Q13 TaxID=2806551 RepID=UPI00193C768E|nr:carboxypeptidase regulatory-like domain-containing protein [Polaribacter sp. Q13]QVY67399.1 carboxypeptidase regulatory-like domain-containing protein [Polaribacter sp. Q13]